MWEILGTKVRFLDYPTKPFVGKTVDTPIKTCAVTGVTGVTGGAGMRLPFESVNQIFWEIYRMLSYTNLYHVYSG